jgi:DNA-binding NtrC family response regulator
VDDIITAVAQPSTADTALVVKDGADATVTLMAGDPSARQSVRSVLERAGYAVAEAREEGNEVVPLAELERRAIDHALRVTGGRVAKAAKLLGIGRATLYRRLAERAALEKGETVTP